MQFEFNKEKSEANKFKHGVSFEEATQIWEQIFLSAPAKTLGEPRFMAIGPIGEQLYTCIYTPRGETIRLISCRRARAKEGQLYHEHIRKEISED